MAGIAWAEKSEVWFNEGIKALEAENYEKAIKCFKKTLAKNPHFSLDAVYDGKGMKWFIKEKMRTYLRRKPINLPSFEKSAKKLLRKAEIMSERAQSFDEKKALMKLGMNSFNGFYYRFDEHIKEAICEKRSLRKDKTQKNLSGFGFEFNSSDTLKFKPKRGEFVLEGGVLKFRYTRGDCLRSFGDLNIVKDSIGEIELRIKLKKARKIQLGWNKWDSVEWEGKGYASVTIDTVPDDTFHTYRINAINFLRRRNIIKKVFLCLLNVNNDEVEIDYIRFISKREKYGKEPYGEAYETMAKEMRKVLYINTPLCLRYTLDLPEEKTFLSFSMGILEENDPVSFRVVVKSKDTQKEVFSKEILNTDTWQDAKIELSQWSGKSVEILFQTDSAKGNIAFWSNPIIYTPPEEKFNVIIVLEDALRADHMSCYGHFRETTPIKDKFIKKGVLFLNAFSQATKTMPSCPSIMTSLYPTATGVWNFSDMLDDNYLTIAEIMRHQGFATASFIQNGNAGPLVGLHQGFSNLFDSGTVGSRAEEIYGKELYGWIEAHSDRNIFLYLHLLDPHGIYDPPKPFDSWYREAPPGKIFVRRDTTYHDPEWVKTPTLEGRRLLYDGEIRYNDFRFEKFLDKLKECKLLDDTLIVFIADHGEHLGEHGLWEHHPPGYIQGIQVPLLMVYPKKLPRNVEITQPVQLLDIMPTILDLANIDKGNLLIEGDSLVSLIYGKDLGFWDNRLSFSEEVVSKSKDDKSEWASVFYKNWHILNSNKIRDDLFKLIKLKSGRKIYETFFTTRVFDYLKDKEEKYYLDSFLADMFFNYKVKRFVQELQENNVVIWKALTEDTKRIIKYDPEVVERLRGLGYLQ